MTSQRSFFLALSFSAMAAALGASPAQAQSTVIHLDWGSGSTCDFNTTGIRISGTAASDIVTESGSFVTNSNCPQGGGNTGTAAVSLSATPASINAGETAQITWSATADVCRYDGSSLPAALSNWQTSGYACVGASECQAGANYSATFNTAGNYTLKLTCLSGGQNGQIATQQFKTATVQVGGGGGGGGSANCVAPSGWTRQTTGTIARTSSANMQTNVPLTDWKDVIGWDLANNAFYNWPGLQNEDTKLYVDNNKYIALKFTVPSSYPRFGYPLNTPIYNYGRFQTNGSPPIEQNTWTLAISPTCGDFDPAPSASGQGGECWVEFHSNNMPYFSWVVEDPGNEVAGRCNLVPGDTYFLNIAARTHASATSTCSASVCHANLINGGNTQGTYTPQ
ncbi:MAG: hypothetical protein WCD36_12610 [Rhodanobacteraceae bacterium]